ncbi:MAG: glutathione peroxidase [Phycisphaeraceae bacterium]
MRCCSNTLSRKLLLTLAAVGLVLGVGNFVMTYIDQPAHAAEDKPAEEPTKVPEALNFRMKDIVGQDVHLSRYYGDVVLMVNTASKCGLTPQYEQLQALHESHHEAGLSILGFPANNFGKQEPGSDDDIKAFCKKNYGVEFAMFSKVSVKGKDITPLYAFLTGKETNPQFAGPIQWNFDKFLVGRDGKVIARFSPRTKPDAKEVVEAIEKALKQPIPDDVEQVRALYAPKDEKQAEGEDQAE